MSTFTPLLAQAGIGDMSSFDVLFVLAVWPFHIHTAFAGPPYLRGYGLAASAFQMVTLIALVLGFIWVLRSPRVSRWLKILYLPLGYPLATLATNVLPALFS